MLLNPQSTQIIYKCTFDLSIIALEIFVQPQNRKLYILLKLNSSISIYLGYDVMELDICTRHIPKFYYIVKYYYTIIFF